MRCLSCHADNDDFADVCLSCGQSLAGAFKPGSVVASRYEILTPLGKGGMGMVYKAHDRVLEEEIAIKVLRADVARSPDMARRFRSEIRLARKVTHRNVCRIHEYGEDQGLRYISMELIEGVDLKKVIRERKGGLPEPEAFELSIQIARGLQAIHEVGIVHRDLKTANIMRDARGVVKLMDFGIAKEENAGNTSATAAGDIVGTPEYMSPEQAEGSLDIDTRTDVYSLGAVLYAMLTGRPPFQAASPVDTVLLVLEQEPVPPRVLNPLADRDLEMIALKCLQKPPELRYASAAALAADLDAYLHDEPVSARNGLFSQVMTRWFRETHHAPVLEHWGALWMWHSLVLLVISLWTNWLHVRGHGSPWPYLGLWTAGLGAWASIFWALRRRAGPVTFVERQIAHVWASSLAAIAIVFVVEMLLGLPVLTLSPLLAISSGMVFLVKAGMLSGRFYGQAVALFATAVAMAWLQRNGYRWGITLFGVVAAISFFLPGWKYHRQRVCARQTRV